jgi:hypothetical protein
MTTEIQPPKRGAIASPRSMLAAAAPYVAIVGAPPNFIVRPQQISMWGNDVHGDCVTAEEAFAKACNSPEIFISDSEVIAWATQHGVLEGAYLTQVMQLMQNDGFRQAGYIYDDGPYFSVNWADPATLHSAIAAGPVKIGVAADQLEAAWRSTGGHTGWFGVGFHPDAAEDHCVSLCGYGTLAWLAQQLGVPVPAGIDGTRQGYALFTWNTIGIIDQPSMAAITAEAWLRQPTTVIRAQALTWVFRDFAAAQGPAAAVNFLNAPARQGHGEASAAARDDGSVGLFFLAPGSLGSSTQQTWEFRNFTAAEGPAGAVNFLNEPARQGAGEASAFARSDGSVGLFYLAPGSLGSSTRQTWFFRNFTPAEGTAGAINFLNASPRQGPGEASAFARNDGSVGLFHLEPGTG